MSHKQDSPARIWQIHSLSFSHCTSLHDPLCAHVLNLVSAQDSTSLWLFGCPSAQCWKFTWNGLKWISHMTKLCTYVCKYTRWSTYRRSVTPYITCNCVRGTESYPCTWIAVMDIDTHIITVSKTFSILDYIRKQIFWRVLTFCGSTEMNTLSEEYVTAKQVHTVTLPCNKHSIVYLFFLMATLLTMLLKGEAESLDRNEQSLGRYQWKNLC